MTLRFMPKTEGMGFFEVHVNTACRKPAFEYEILLYSLPHRTGDKFMVEVKFQALTYIEPPSRNNPWGGPILLWKYIGHEVLENPRPKRK
jgi:hypothetical protein